MFRRSPALLQERTRFAAAVRNYALVSLWIVVDALFGYLAIDNLPKHRSRALLFATTSAILCGLAVQSHYLALFPVVVIQTMAPFQNVAALASRCHIHSMCCSDGRCNWVFHSFEPARSATCSSF